VIRRVSVASTRTGRGTILKERPKPIILILYPDLGSFGGSRMRVVGQRTTTIVALKEIRDQRTGRTRNLEMRSRPVSSAVLSMSWNRRSMFVVHVLKPPLTNV
jgi:cation transporter-like permease